MNLMNRGLASVGFVSDFNHTKMQLCGITSKSDFSSLSSRDHQPFFSTYQNQYSTPLKSQGFLSCPHRIRANAQMRLNCISRIELPIACVGFVSGFFQAIRVSIFSFINCPSGSPNFQSILIINIEEIRGDFMASKNAWFKHYNYASSGHTLSVLWANNDTEAVALFWLILELVSRFEDELERGKITISWSVLSRETNWKPSKCRRVLARISPVSKIEINEEREGYVSFLVPNWLELQERRGGKKEAKKEQNSDRGERREERGEMSDVESAKKTTAPNSVEAFEARMKGQTWVDALKLWRLDKPELKNNVHLLQQRFENPDNFSEFINEIVTREKYQEIKRAGDAQGCDRYLSAALRREMGLT